MRVVRADAMGMCFGVRDALLAIEAIARPERVTIHGELVHNGVVLRRLAARGFVQSDERGRDVPATPDVLITAHGISQRERRRLRAAGRQLLDTTCPLVWKAHEAAQLLAAEGRRVVVVGRRDHVEVRGLVEDLVRPIVVRDESEVGRYPERRLGVVCQTTAAPERVDAVVTAIRSANPGVDVKLIDTVCNPTKARGAALTALLPQVDALVVVGGHGSNNTRRLAARGVAASVPTLHVEDEGELVVKSAHGAWFAGREVVGLTAGTSTLPSTVDAVERRLGELAAGPAATG